MNNTQRILLVIYMPLTFLIIFFHTICPKENMIFYLKYTIMISLFLSAIIMRKKYREQKLMTLSLFFLVVADFFLVFISTIDKLNIDLSVLGATGFLFAYLCLISAYQKNFKVGKAGNNNSYSYNSYFYLCMYISKAICNWAYSNRRTNIWGGIMLHDLDINLYDFQKVFQL